MPVFLPWLETRCVEAGVELVRGWVSDLAEVPGDLVVLAAGLRSGTLVDDHAGTPSRGQVALLANPGLTHWLVDDEHPDGMVYVLPHPDWVVCGGTDVAGSWHAEPDRHVHDAIVRRVRAVVPALARAKVLGAQVGLRAGGARCASRHPREAADRWSPTTATAARASPCRGGAPTRWSASSARLPAERPQASDAGRERPAFVSPRRFLAAGAPRAAGGAARRGAGGEPSRRAASSAIAALEPRRGCGALLAVLGGGRGRAAGRPTSRGSSTRSTRARCVSLNPPNAPTSSSTSTRLSAVLTP